MNKRMEFYSDYEALSFNSEEAVAKGVYPYYLDFTKAKESVCPLALYTSNYEGEIVDSQSIDSGEGVSFIKLLNNLVIRANYERRELNIKNRGIIKIFFHNLGFDSSIFLHELLHQGFKHVVEESNTLIYEGDVPYRRKEDNCFTILGDSVNDITGINIYYKKYRFFIRDTFKIIPMGQDKILKIFGYSSKVDVNWNSINIHNLDEQIELIKSRCEYDVISLAKSFHEFKQTIHEQFKGVGDSASSISLDCYKAALATQEKILYKDRQKAFEVIFPGLPYADFHRLTYFGGVSILNPKYKGVVMKDIAMVDVNSSYPASMCLELPYGIGTPINDFTEKGYTDYIVRIKFKMKGLPFVRANNVSKTHLLLNVNPPMKRYKITELISEYDGYLSINSIDLKLLKKYSDISHLEFIEGINFTTKSLLKDYIEELYQLRKDATGGKKTALKLLLNGLYGKFGQDLSSDTKMIYESFSKNGSRSISVKDTNPNFIPLASAVTAYSRTRFIDMVYFLGDYFIYGDTDSVFFKNVGNKTLDKLSKEGFIDDNELGLWGQEEKYINNIKKAKFLASKKYFIELNDGGKVVKCAGLKNSSATKFEFDDFKYDATIKTTQFKMGYGGKRAVEVKYTINEFDGI